jgi:predicted XRE-type DNA-binding protein
VKRVVWLGNSLARIRLFPADAKRAAGYQLERVQAGREPADRGAEVVTSGRLKRVRGSGNVFRDIGLGKDDAENLKLRSELMMRIEDFYRKSNLTQADAAATLGLTQPRLNALLKGKIDLFSLDALVNIANRAGLSVRLVVRKAA